MSKFSKRTTVCFDPKLHDALCQKAACSNQSVSGIVNGAIRVMLDEDGEDLGAFDEHSEESAIDFEAIVKKLAKDKRSSWVFVNLRWLMCLLRRPFFGLDSGSPAGMTMVTLSAN